MVDCRWGTTPEAPSPPPAVVPTSAASVPAVVAAADEEEGEESAGGARRAASAEPYVKAATAEGDGAVAAAAAAALVVDMRFRWREASVTAGAEDGAEASMVASNAANTCPLGLRGGAFGSVRAAEGALVLMPCKRSEEEEEAVG